VSVEACGAPDVEQCALAGLMFASMSGGPGVMPRFAITHIRGCLRGRYSVRCTAHRGKPQDWEDTAMLMLKLLAAITVIVVALIVYYAIESHCEERYGSSPLSRGAFLTSGFAAWAVHLGWQWRLDLIANRGDALNGTVVVAVGAGLLFMVVMRNYAKLGPGYGSIATLLQAGLLPLAMLAAVLYLPWRVIRNVGVVPVRIVNDK
jgi:hypothetical protein